MALTAGTRVGSYEILAPLGAGGMGEVYRARDTKLRREVALKVLPDAFATDGERLARFEREAQLLAALNHPNIAAIYGLEQSADRCVLAMELVDGETLADRIGHGGPLALDDALAMARQIAGALQAAHEKGIVHRDLKPANIALTGDGQVKVLDFGLAKAMDVAPAGASVAGGAATLSPTISLAMTQAGMILGTAAYMSPEQAKGRPADKRADVWAFGCVLYEMLTARRAFAGDDAAETLAFIITKEPDWSLLPADTPVPVKRLLRRCLRKDPRERLHDIADARLEIEDAVHLPHEETPAVLLTAARERYVRIPWIVAALATIAAAGFAAFGFTRSAADAPTIRFTVAAPEGHALSVLIPATSAPGGVPAPLAVSPDGRHVAFLANEPSGRSRIWIRTLDALEARVLAGTEGAAGPCWSPDSRSLAFHANGRLRRIDIAGGPSVPLADAPDYRGCAWGRSGIIVFAPGSVGPLLRVSDKGGIATPATIQADGDTGHARPSFLPDGRRFFYRVYNGGIYLASLDSPDRTLVIEEPDATNVAYPQGHLLFVRETTLMAQPFDVGARALTGEAVPLAEHIQRLGTPPWAFFSASENGVLVYRAGDPASGGQITWVDRTGRGIGTLGDLAGYSDLQMSPDGTRTAVVRIDGESARDIWIYDNPRNIRTRFTFDAVNVQSPVWSPDGSEIVFASSRNGRLNLFRKSTSGVAREELVLADSHNKNPLSWSRDGRYLVYVASGGSTNRSDLMVLPMSGEPKPFAYLDSPASESTGRLSPDDKWMAYVSDESRQNEVYVAPFPEPTSRVQISIAGGHRPRWSADGRTIVYLAPTGPTLMAADVNVAGDRLQVTAVRELFDTPGLGGSRYVWDMSPDGRRFLLNVLRATASEEPLSVVLNWTNLLRK